MLFLCSNTVASNDNPRPLVLTPEELLVSLATPHGQPSKLLRMYIASQVWQRLFQFVQ